LKQNIRKWGLNLEKKEIIDLFFCFDVKEPSPHPPQKKERYIKKHKKTHTKKTKTRTHKKDHSLKKYKIVY